MKRHRHTRRAVIRKLAATAAQRPGRRICRNAHRKGLLHGGRRRGVFTFGDAVFHGSMGHTRLNAPVVALVPTADSGGYWLVASDGGVFAFGNASFRGSMGGTRLNKAVKGMIRFGSGYLMVASDGGIFNFSDRPFYGSLGDRPPAQPIVSVAAFTG